jgi:hypothetical protein
VRPEAEDTGSSADFAEYQESLRFRDENTEAQTLQTQFLPISHLGPQPQMNHGKHCPEKRDTVSGEGSYHQTRTSETHIERDNGCGQRDTGALEQGESCSFRSGTQVGSSVSSCQDSFPDCLPLKEVIPGLEGDIQCHPSHLSLFRLL